MRPRLAAVALAALLVALAIGPPLVLFACGGTATDPFVGVWWEPSTGRRIEIRADGDAYTFLYGAAKRAYPATRTGDELRIREPMGGSIIVRARADDSLELVTGGATSLLERVPQHQ